MGGQAEEAKAHMAQAEKALKSSWMSMKFSPDHLSASMEYASAATKFRAANMLEESVTAWLLSANSKEKQHDVFGAGRAYESAGGICDGKGPGGPEAASVHLEKAVHCFRLAGKGDIAVKNVLKLATMYEARKDTAKTKAAFQDAIEIYENDEKDYNLSDVYKTYIGFLIRQELFDEALTIIDAHAKLLARQKHWPFVHKELLAKVVLLLRLQDNVRAEQATTPEGPEIQGWFMSKECQVGSELVAAFQAMDAESVERLLKDQVFSFLQVEIARIAKQLKIPGLPAGTVAKQAPQQAAAPAPGNADGAQSTKEAAGYTQAEAPAAPTADDMASLLM